MKNMLISCVLCCIVLFPVLLWAETEKEEFTVSGEISFPKTGDLYVELVTEEQYQHDDEDGPETPFALIIAVGEEEEKSKTVSFEFEGVPEGTYGIRVFQDVNGNGELDAGMFGPKEPWGMYRPKRPKFRGPKFEEIAFEVKEDLTEIQFDIK